MAAATVARYDMSSRDELQVLIGRIISPVLSKSKKRKRKRQQQTTIESTPDLLHPQSDCLKKIKEICEQHEKNCESALELLVESLRTENSHVRLLILQVIHTLFTGSKYFRSIVGKMIQEIMFLCIGKSLDRDLPPPLKLAGMLKNRFIEYFAEWHKKFGADIKHLRTGHVYMSKKRQIRFPVAAAPNATVPVPVIGANDASRLGEIRILETELRQMRGSIENNIFQMESCLSILQPSIFDNDDSGGADTLVDMASGDLKSDSSSGEGTDNGDEWLDAETGLPAVDAVEEDSTWEKRQELLMETGLGSASESISIDLNQALKEMKELSKTGDVGVLENLSGCQKVLSRRHLPIITRWMSKLDGLGHVVFSDQSIAVALAKHRSSVLKLRDRARAASLRCNDLGLGAAF